MEPTMTVEMHDHEAANSCECMNENKDNDIRTIYSHAQAENNAQLNETCESSNQQNLERAGASSFVQENS